MTEITSLERKVLEIMGETRARFAVPTRERTTLDLAMARALADFIADYESGAPIEWPDVLEL